MDMPPTSEDETSLPVILGVLRETLVGKRQILCFLATNRMNGGEVGAVTEQAQALAWRIGKLELLAGGIEQVLPQEANFQALRRFQPLVGFPTFRQIRPTDITDGRELLIRDRGRLDMGEIIDVD